MTVSMERPRPPADRAADLPAQVHRRFEAVAFDWDGTAVPDRTADAEHVRTLVEAGAEVQFVGELRHSLEEVYLQLVRNS